MTFFQFIFFVAGLPTGALLTLFLRDFFRSRRGGYPMGPGMSFFGSCLAGLLVAIGLGLVWETVFGRGIDLPLPFYWFGGHVLGTGWLLYLAKD